jgi:hypothetical protein
MEFDIKNELRAIQLHAKNIFLANEFPDPIFKNENWKCMFLESNNIFNNSDYKAFISFIHLLNENKFYVAPDYLISKDLDKYYDGLTESASKYVEPLTFTSTTSFDEFNNKQIESRYRSENDAIIFGLSGNWGIYNDSFIDIMMIGFNPEFSSIVDSIYSSDVNRLSLADLIDEVQFWAKKEKIESVKERIRKNYGFALV